MKVSYDLFWCVVVFNSFCQCLTIHKRNIQRNQRICGNMAACHNCTCADQTSMAAVLGWESGRQPCELQTIQHRDSCARLINRLVTDNKLKDLLFIETNTSVSGYSGRFPIKVTGRMHRWGCDSIMDQDLSSWVIPPLLTVFIECPHLNVTDIMEKVCHMFSGGRRGFLTRPIMNWVILKGAPLSPYNFLSLMSKADVILHVSPWDPVLPTCRHNPQSKYDTVSLVRIWKLGASSPATYNVNLNINDLQAGVTCGLLPGKYNGFNGQTFIVTSAPNYAPYNAVTKFSNGSEQFDGLAIDVIRSLAQQHNFKLKFVYSIDRKYGGQNSDGSWNGMVGMVKRGEADFVSAALTITSQRQTAVDFTTAYYHKAVGILIYLSDQDNNYFTFLTPLTYQVWMAYTGAVALALVTIALMRHLHQTPNDAKSSTTSEYTSLQIPPAIYFFGTVTYQSVVLNVPRGSMRWVVGGLWFLVVVMTSTYSANLVATLSTQKLSLPFTDLFGLVEQNLVLPLVNDGSSTLTLMKNSESAIYNRVWGIIRDNPATLYKTQAEADEKLNSGRFARIGDFTGLQVRVAKHPTCNLFLLPDRFFPSGYGIALSKDSPFREIFTETVLRLQEGGLDGYWFDNHLPEDRCTQKLKVSASSRPMSIQHLSGLFLILSGGMGVAILALILEAISNKIWLARLKRVKTQN